MRSRHYIIIIYNSHKNEHEHYAKNVDNIDKIINKQIWMHISFRMTLISSLF